MSHAKPSKQRTKVIPVLGAAGLSLSLAGEAPAATGGLAAHLVTPNNEARHELALGEEEIFDVTLATFYVVNEENPGFPTTPTICHGRWRRLRLLRRLRGRDRQSRNMDAGWRRKSAATFYQTCASAEAHARSEEPIALAWRVGTQDTIVVSRTVNNYPAAAWVPACRAELCNCRRAARPSISRPTVPCR